MSFRLSKILKTLPLRLALDITQNMCKKSSNMLRKPHLKPEDLFVGYIFFSISLVDQHSSHRFSFQQLNVAAIMAGTSWHRYVTTLKEATLLVSDVYFHDDESSVSAKFTWRNTSFLMNMKPIVNYLHQANDIKRL